MKTEIEVSFNYGGWGVSFSKTFDLPFAPFYGLWLYDGDKDLEHHVRLDNNDYCSTIISYDTTESTFYVNIRNVWRKAVSDDVIDHTVFTFKKAGWKREDSTNIKELKELMNRNVANEIH